MKGNSLAMYSCGDFSFFLFLFSLFIGVFFSFFGVTYEILAAAPPEMFPGV